MTKKTRKKTKAVNKRVAHSSKRVALHGARYGIGPQQIKDAVSITASRPRLLHLLSWAAVQLDTFVRPAYEAHPDTDTRTKFAALLAEIRHIVDTEYKPLTTS